MKLTIDFATYYDEIAAYESKIQFLKMELANTKEVVKLANKKNLTILADQNKELTTTKTNNARLNLENEKLYEDLEALRNNLSNRDDVLAKHTTIFETLTEQNNRLKVELANAKNNENLLNLSNTSLIAEQDKLMEKLENIDSETMDLENKKLNEVLEDFRDKSIGRANCGYMVALTMLTMMCDGEDFTLDNFIESFDTRFDLGGRYVYYKINAKDTEMVACLDALYNQGIFGKSFTKTECSQKSITFRFEQLGMGEFELFKRSKKNAKRSKSTWNCVH